MSDCGIPTNKKGKGQDIYWTDIGISRNDVDDIRTESACQDIDGHGEQTLSADRWLLILTKKMGDLAEAISYAHYTGSTGSLEGVHLEAVQCATIALKIGVMAKESAHTGSDRG